MTLKIDIKTNGNDEKITVLTLAPNRAFNVDAKYGGRVVFLVSASLTPREED